MELLLKRGSKVVGHLPQGIAGSVADSVVAVLAEGKHGRHHLVQDGLHLLATPLTDGRDGHQGTVPVVPVLWGGGEGRKWCVG